MLALELNDAGLVLARGVAGEVGTGAILAESPGVALLEGNAVVTGVAAARRARQRPLFTHSTYWRELGLTPLPRPTAGLKTTADLAFAHLDELLTPYRTENEPLLVAVPPGYTREQLGVLIGVVNETRVTLAGLVDAGLAASALTPIGQRVLHLDLELNRAVLTVLEHQGTDLGLKRTHFEIQLRLGALGFQQAWIERIAELFVRKTRFDPLHQAASEQMLVDRLGDWLGQLRDQESVTAEIEAGDEVHRVELTRAQMVDAIQARYSELVRLVQAARPAGVAIELLLGDRLAQMPGAVEAFGQLRDCVVRTLPRGAAALGAITHTATIERPPAALAVVYRLPAATTATIEPASGGYSATMPEEQRPTHALFAGKAWAITDQPLRLGWAVPEDQRRLPVPQGAPGVSRLHCTLVRRDGVITVEDHSTYGSYVNEERVKGVTALKVGDRLRLGAPGVQVDLIQLVNDHGAPHV